MAHFRIVAKLGQGGMGVVYRAEDEKLRRPVAIKLLQDAGRDERRQRFLREARSAAAVTHPNVAVVHAVDEADGRIYIAMELVEGENLRARLDRGRLDVATAKELAEQIARGLAAAHEKGIVHRDLKPENVMITPAGVVKLLDFGLAKVGVERPASGKTDAALAKTEAALAKTETVVTSDEGRVMGTPEYMSPEQALGETLDVRSDVFSLGIVLYEMLSGTRPFGGTTTGAILVAIARDEAPPLRERAPEVDEATQAVVMRCLAKAPAERFGSASEIVTALTGKASPVATTQSRTDVEAVTRSGVAPRRSRRAVVAAGVVAVGVLVVAGVAVGAFAWSAHTRAKHAPAEGAPSASAAAPRAVTLLDLPPPPTNVPEAAREYALGMGSMHDDNGRAALEHFSRVVKLDPAMAAGHLRAAMAGHTLETVRAEFVRANELRAQLTERDQALMNALEPVLQRARPDVAEAARRVEAISQRSPLDVELYDWLADLRQATPDALTPSERAIALDPADAWAWQNRGDALANVGRIDEARVVYERCTALSLSSSDCLISEAQVDEIAGRCADFESDSRRLADRSDSTGHWYLVSALVSTGHPEAAVREEGKLFTDLLPEADRKLHTLKLDTQLALIAGDFAAARVLAARQATALAADPTLRSDRWEHYALTMQTLTAALETEDAAAARQAAQDFTDRRGSWSAHRDYSFGLDLSVFIAHLAAGDLEAIRSERMEAWLAESPPRGLVWTYAYAAPATTPEEARAALDTMPAFAPITWFKFEEHWGTGIPDASTGHAHLLAGKPDEALPYLKRAVAACMAFPEVLAHTRAALDLGTALEQTSDAAGACAAYKIVLDRWGHAKPHSVTADAARAHATKLGCAP